MRSNVVSMPVRPKAEVIPWEEQPPRERRRRRRSALRNSLRWLRDIVRSWGDVPRMAMIASAAGLLAFAAGWLEAAWLDAANRPAPTPVYQPASPFAAGAQPIVVVVDAGAGGGARR